MSELAHLLAPLPVDHFLRRHWPERWCVIDGPLERLPPWLRAPPLHDLAALGRAFCGVGYVNRATHCHPAEIHYTGDDTKPEVLLGMGVTQTFPAVQRFIPECAAGLAALGDALGVPPGMFEAHLLVSPRGEGLRWHFDPCDTFVVQLRGSKRWSVADNRHVRHPVGTPFAPGMRPTWQHVAQMPDALPVDDPTEGARFELRAGSVLFLPRGLWHRTDASDETSISLSLSSKVPTLGDRLLEQVEAVLLQDPAMRRFAYGLAGDAAERGALLRDLERCVARLPALLRAVSARGALDGEGRPAPRAEAPTLATRFYRDPSTRMAVERSAGGSLRVLTDVSALLLPERRGAEGAFACSADAEPLVAWVDRRPGIFEGQALAAAFPDIDADGVMALLQSMLEVGLIGVVHFPRADLDAAERAGEASRRPPIAQTGHAGRQSVAPRETLDG